MDTREFWDRAASENAMFFVDNYGHCSGARRAVEYFAERGGRPLLARVDYTGRIAVKT